MYRQFFMLLCWRCGPRRRRRRRRHNRFGIIHRVLLLYAFS